jgi:hypothetical protein
MTKECFERARASKDKGVLIHRVCNEADELFYSDNREELSQAHRTVLCVETFFAAMCDGGFAAWFDGTMASSPAAAASRCAVWG